MKIRVKTCLAGPYLISLYIWLEDGDEGYSLIDAQVPFGVRNNFLDKNVISDAVYEATDLIERLNDENPG